MCTIVRWVEPQDNVALCNCEKLRDIVYNYCEMSGSGDIVYNCEIGGASSLHSTSLTSCSELGGA